jgi:hypothetical protein
MINVPVVCRYSASIAQDVRVFSSGEQHVYGPGGKILDSPALRAKNERARQLYEQELARSEQQHVPIQ